MVAIDGLFTRLLGGRHLGLGIRESAHSLIPGPFPLVSFSLVRNHPQHLGQISVTHQG
jgi:hypothetical protein